jgi:death on curing protein
MRRDSKFAPPGPLGDCDRSIIESALAAPGTGWGGAEKYPDLPAKAAALMYALAKSQACIDGNKRVAVLLTDAFVAMNGGLLARSHDDVVEAVLAIAESDAADREEVVVQLTDWMREHVRVEDEEDV